MIIGIEKLSILCEIGCNKEERGVHQEIQVDCQLKLLSEPNIDDIHDTVSYDEVIELIETVARKGAFFLLEIAAKSIAEAILKRFVKVESVLITIRKPHILSGRAIPYVQTEVKR